MGNVFSFLRSEHPIQTINCQTDNDRLYKSNQGGFKEITEIHTAKSCIQLVECNKSDLPITVELPPLNDGYEAIVNIDNDFVDVLTVTDENQTNETAADILKRSNRFHNSGQLFDHLEITQSSFSSKTKSDSSCTNFKSVTVALERISKQKILEYTKKSEQNVINCTQLTSYSTSKLQKKNGNGSDDSNNIRSLRSHIKKWRNQILVTSKQKSCLKKQNHKKLIARYCPECRKTINSSSMKDSTCCIICKTKLLFECLNCNNSSYKSYEGIRYHMLNSCKYRKNTSILQFPNCPRYFTRSFSLQYHIRFCGNKANLVSCAHCSFRTHKKWNLSEHLRTHFKENEELVECYKCGKTLKNKKSLKYHISRCENNDAHLKCEFCPFKTKHRSSIIRHLQTHNSETTDKDYGNI